MMPRIRRFWGAAWIGVFIVGAQFPSDRAWGADSVVPSAWNVAPMTAGAYLESFDATLPVWAGRVGSSYVTNSFPAMASSALPSRSNAWFGANAKVLQLSTDGLVITNALIESNGSNVTFSTQPVFVDMRVKFDAVTDTPDATLLAQSKLAVFVSSDSKLVAVHANGWTTNSVALDTNLWYQLTIKMINGVYAVLLNDQIVFNNLTLQNVGAANTLQATTFYGTGLIDELYVSHGDPAYAISGAATAIPSLPAAGSNPPSDAQQTRINAWLSTRSGITTGTTLNMTQDQLSQAYLLNELGGDSSAATAVTYAFGISSIEMTSPTSLTVTLALTANAAAKNGAINGRIQLAGKVNIDDSAWTTLAGAITPSYADFTNGKATYTFTVPGGYQFFKPLIVP